MSFYLQKKSTKKELMNAVKVIDWRGNIETLVEHAGMGLVKSKPIWS